MSLLSEDVFDIDIIIKHLHKLYNNAHTHTYIYCEPPPMKPQGAQHHSLLDQNTTTHNTHCSLYTQVN